MAPGVPLHPTTPLTSDHAICPVPCLGSPHKNALSRDVLPSTPFHASPRHRILRSRSSCHIRGKLKNLLPLPCPLPNKNALPRRVAPDTPYPQQARHIARQPDGLEKNALVLSTPLPLPARHAASGSMAPGSPLHPPPQYFMSPNPTPTKTPCVAPDAPLYTPQRHPPQQARDVATRRHVHKIGVYRMPEDRKIDVYRVPEAEKKLTWIVIN